MQIEPLGYAFCEAVDAFAAERLQDAGKSKENRNTAAKFCTRAADAANMQIHIHIQIYGYIVMYVYIYMRTCF